MPQSNGQSILKEFKLKQILKPLAIIVPLAIAGNIIYILLASEPNLISKLSNYHIEYLLLAILLVFIPWITHSVRMLLWSRVFGRKLQPKQAFKTAVAAEVGSDVTPTSVGGGYFKLGFMVRYGFSPAEATLMMILGTVEDGLFFAIALPLAIIHSRAWDNLYVKLALDNIISHLPILIIVILLAVLIYFISIRFRLKLKALGRDTTGDRPTLRTRIKVGLKKYKDDFIDAVGFALSIGKGTFGLCVILSGIGWCCRYGAISALVFGLGYPADPVLLFLLQWVIFSTMAFIPTPGAAGGAEVAFAVVFKGIVPAGVLPLLTIAWRFLTYYLLAGVGALILAFAGVSFGNGKTNNDKIGAFEEIKA
jgi:glycosyltransferase 2 family protein